MSETHIDTRDANDGAVEVGTAVEIVDALWVGPEGMDETGTADEIVNASVLSNGGTGGNGDNSGSGIGVPQTVSPPTTGNAQPIFVGYNVPQYVVGVPGSQNSACTGSMRITPGATEAFVIKYGNSDGVPINLSGFTLRLVFWFMHSEYELLASNLSTNIIMAKDLQVSDPYTGTCTVVLTDQETIKLAMNGRMTLRWSIYMISNDDGQVYPSQITATGERYGLAYLDRAEIPFAERIKGISVSHGTG